MIRIAQFSDLHYGEKHLTEADPCFRYAVERAIALQVDAAVISGDATDHALDVRSPAIACLARQVRRLAEYCPVLMLQGTYSNEPPVTLALFPVLGGRYHSIRMVAMHCVMSHRGLLVYHSRSTASCSATNLASRIACPSSDHPAAQAKW